MLGIEQNNMAKQIEANMLLEKVHFVEEDLVRCESSVLYDDRFDTNTETVSRQKRDRWHHFR